jgi:Icc-related predicted phosphoesterase
MRCFFVSDLHGRTRRYELLFRLIEDEQPEVVFLGGDLLPNACGLGGPGREGNFIGEVLAAGFEGLRDRLLRAHPRVVLIPGNDDPRCFEAEWREGEARGLWEYVHDRSTTVGDWTVYGYACVSPTPFRLKDWERYDVSRQVEPGCIPPDEGLHTTPFELGELKHTTIRSDLDRLFGDDDLSRGIGLLHCPPYDTNLDRAGLDGRMIDHVPLDVHVGSIAIRRFIEERQPLLTLHGHIHESARLTGRWRDRIGRTHLMSAAHDGVELALVRFDPNDPAGATRELL